MTRDELLVAIVRCPEIDRARADSRHPCADIVGWQKADFQAPEPWRGRIDSAPILFLSSNPSIDENERSRVSSKTDAEIIEYYQRSFDSDAGHISASAYNSVAFWRGVRARAAELLGRDAAPGVDFALTELVHCKSRGEQGVARAHLTCAGRWLDPVLGVSGASVVVLLGRQARDHCVARWKLDKGWSVYWDVATPGRERAVVVLPHPNARGKRKVGDLVGADDLQKLRALVSGQD